MPARIELPPENTARIALAANLLRLRNQIGWSVPECADYCRISTSQWYKLEQGNVEHVSLDLLDRLCSLFETDRRELLKPVK